MFKFEKRNGWEGFVYGEFHKVYGFLQDEHGFHRVIQKINEKNEIRYEIEIMDAPYDGHVHFHMETIAEPS